MFKLSKQFEPAGDQPRAIKELVEGLKKGLRYQTLLGVTGSGKTFTVANVIEKIGKPTLVIAHNKTLAAQLAQEYREFFPNNAVHYFVSYYDFYQPEAYMPITDTYIEKEAMINEEIERLRHASTQALLTRKDVIIVASVSCIYGLGNPEEYEKVNLKLQFAQYLSRSALIRDLVNIHFTRTNADVNPGTFRALGNVVEIMPVSERMIYRIEIENERIQKILKIDAVSRTVVKELEVFYLFPAKHFITGNDAAKRALSSIKLELEVRLKELKKESKLLEAERLKRRTTYDLAMIREVGYTNGIENYSQEEALERTHRWAERSLLQHSNILKNVGVLVRPALFGIVQGGREESLRKKSAEFIGALDFDGFGIGGSFAKEDMETVVKWVNELLPKEKPRHLLGIGEPEDLFMGVENGVDLFDCVAPTRNGRGGTLYTSRGKINIRNAEFREDTGPIDADCKCPVCSTPSVEQVPHTRAYLCHLYRAHEMLGGTLGSMHNLYFIINLVKRMRQSILDNNFLEFKKAFLEKYL